MSLVIWAIATFMLGLVGYIAVPVLIAPSLALEKRQRIASIYFKQAMSMFRQAHLVELSPNNHTLVSTEPKPTWPADEASLGDKRVHWEDPNNRKVRLFGRPFGAAPSAFNTTVHPRDAELGELHEQHEERGDHRVNVQTDGGVRECWNKHMTVSEKPKLVSLHGIRGLLGQSGEPDSAEISYDYVEKSQRGFNSRDLVSVMTFLIAFLAVFGAIWFFMTQLGGGGGGGVVNVPLMLGGWL